MKYVIDVPGEQDVTYNTEHKVYLTVSEGIASVEVGIDAEPYTEPDRKTIEDEVWEFVKEIILRDNGTHMSGMLENELNECFGYPYYSDMFATHSYQEAKSKYEAWKKQKHEIKIGDEVIAKDNMKNAVGDYYEPFIINGMLFNNVIGFGKKYKHHSMGINDVVKTGRHFTKKEIDVLKEYLEVDEEEKE